MDSHQQKIMTEELLELERRGQNKTPFQYLCEFLKIIPTELIQIIKNNDVTFRVEDLLKKSSRLDKSKPTT